MVEPKLADNVLEAASFVPVYVRNGDTKTPSIGQGCFSCLHGAGALDYKHHFGSFLVMYEGKPLWGGVVDQDTDAYINLPGHHWLKKTFHNGTHMGTVSVLRQQEPARIKIARWFGFTTGQGGPVYHVDLDKRFLDNKALPFPSDHTVFIASIYTYGAYGVYVVPNEYHIPTHSKTFPDGNLLAKNLFMSKAAFPHGGMDEWVEANFPGIVSVGMHRVQGSVKLTTAQKKKMKTTWGFTAVNANDLSIASEDFDEFDEDSEDD